MTKYHKILGSHAFILSGILLLTFIVFSNTLGNDFIKTSDEGPYILTNSHVRGITPQNISAIFSAAPAGMYSPLTIFSYAIDYRIGGYNPRIYHLTSVLYHLLNVALVYFLIFLVSKRKMAAALAAALFAIHPMHAQSVNWIAQRKDLVYSFFYLSSLICYALYLEKKLPKKYLLLTLLFYILSLFSKPAAVTLPLLLLVFDYYYARKMDKRAVLEKIPFFVLSVIFAGILFLPFVTANANQNYIPSYNLAERILAFSYSLMFYVCKLFAPFNLHVFHGWPLKTNGRFPGIYYLMPVLAVLCAALVVLAIKKFKDQKKNLVFGISFFIAAISIVLQIKPFGPVIVADHYTYIPYIGFFFIGAMLLSNLIERKDRAGNGSGWSAWPQASAISGVILLICFFSSLTYQRNAVWKNDYTLLTDSISKDPTVSFAYSNLGSVEQEKNDFKSALAHYNKAIELNPEIYEAYSNRGALRYTLKDFNGALADYNQSIEMRPEYYMPYNNRGVLRFDLSDIKGAVQDYEKAIQLKPSYSVVYYNMGNLKYTAGEKAEAVKYYTKAIELDPFYANAYHNRGVVKMEAQDYQGALEDFNAAIKIKPDYAQAINNRQFLLTKYHLKSD
ncbi:MAG: tetratricopeptide repeat protein [Elusimicrobiota bacterium]|nr:tetratricopeptide repeat protein [Elusimicrobiota bacterium]